MTTGTISAVVLAVVALAAAAGPARAVPDFDEARLLLERGHDAEAHRVLAQLADCGHREAARIALQMRQFGPQLYRMNVQVGPKQLGRWRALLAAPASPSSQADPHPPSACEAPQPAGSAGEQAYRRHHGVG